MREGAATPAPVRRDVGASRSSAGGPALAGAVRHDAAASPSRCSALAAHRQRKHLRRRRRKQLTPKRLTAALGVLTASLVLGWLLASTTVSAIDPFYRHAFPSSWREPPPPIVETTAAPPIAYSPIGWNEAAFPFPPPAAAAPPTTADPYDDTALLADARDPGLDPSGNAEKATPPDQPATLIDPPAPAIALEIGPPPAGPAEAIEEPLPR